MTSSAVVIVVLLVLTSAELLPERRLLAGRRYGLWDGVSRLFRADTLDQARDLASVTSHAIVYVKYHDDVGPDVVWLEVIAEVLQTTPYRVIYVAKETAKDQEDGFLGSFEDGEETTDLFIIHNGTQVLYYGVYSVETLVSFVNQLKQPVLKTISGKSDKKAYDLVDHVKVIAFIDEESKQEYSSYEDVASAFHPYIPFYIISQPRVAKHVDLKKPKRGYLLQSLKGRKIKLKDFDKENLLTDIDKNLPTLLAQIIPSEFNAPWNTPKSNLIVAVFRPITGDGKLISKVLKTLAKGYKERRDVSIQWFDTDKYPMLVPFWEEEYGIDLRQPVIGVANPAQIKGFAWFNLTSLETPLCHDSLVTHVQTWVDEVLHLSYGDEEEEESEEEEDEEEDEIKVDGREAEGDEEEDGDEGVVKVEEIEVKGEEEEDKIEVKGEEVEVQQETKLEKEESGRTLHIGSKSELDEIVVLSDTARESSDENMMIESTEKIHQDVRDQKSNIKTPAGSGKNVAERIMEGNSKETKPKNSSLFLGREPSHSQTITLSFMTRSTECAWWLMCYFVECRPVPVSHNLSAIVVTGTLVGVNGTSELASGVASNGSEEWLPGAGFEDEVSLEEIFYDSAKAAGADFKEIEHHKKSRASGNVKVTEDRKQRLYNEIADTLGEIRQIRQDGKEDDDKNKGLDNVLSSMTDILVMFKPGMLSSFPDSTKDVVENFSSMLYYLVDSISNILPYKFSDAPSKDAKDENNKVTKKNRQKLYQKDSRKGIEGDKSQNSNAKQFENKEKKKTEKTESDIYGDSGSKQKIVSRRLLAIPDPDSADYNSMDYNADYPQQRKLLWKSDKKKSHKKDDDDDDDDDDDEDDDDDDEKDNKKEKKGKKKDYSKEKKDKEESQKDKGKKEDKKDKKEDNKKEKKTTKANAEESQHVQTVSDTFQKDNATTVITPFQQKVIDEADAGTIQMFVDSAAASKSFTGTSGNTEAQILQELRADWLITQREHEEFMREELRLDQEKKLQEIIEKRKQISERLKAESAHANDKREPKTIAVTRDKVSKGSHGAYVDLREEDEITLREIFAHDDLSSNVDFREPLRKRIESTTGLFDGYEKEETCNELEEDKENNDKENEMLEKEPTKNNEGLIKDFEVDDHGMEADAEPNKAILTDDGEIEEHEQIVSDSVGKNEEDSIPNVGSGEEQPDTVDATEAHAEVTSSEKLQESSVQSNCELHSGELSPECSSEDEQTSPVDSINFEAVVGKSVQPVDPKCHETGGSMEGEFSELCAGKIQDKAEATELDDIEDEICDMVEDVFKWLRKVVKLYRSWIPRQ